MAPGTRNDASDYEDPLLLFCDAPVIACMGEWTTDKMNLAISMQNGKWVLKSGQRDLVLTTTDKEFEWSVYETAAMEKEVYVASIAGHGPRTRLTMRPGRQHAGSGKKLVLWRSEHKMEDGEADQRDEQKGQDKGSEGEKQPKPEPTPAIPARDDSPGLIGDAMDAPRDLGSERKPSRGRGRDDEKDRSLSRSRTRRVSRRSKGRKGGGKRGRNDRDYSSDSRGRSRTRSRSRRRGGKGKSRSRRRGGKGSGKQEDDGGPVTTIFVTGLPDDAREDEVRGDLEKEGEIIKVVVMKKGVDRNCFVRFKQAREAIRCMESIQDGKIRICGEGRVKAEMARRNTN